MKTKGQSTIVIKEDKETVWNAITIDKIIPYKEFSMYIDDQQINLSFILEEAASGIRVTINSEGFNQSLANLKALVEGNEILFV